jgi:hypothetical protein
MKTIFHNNWIAKKHFFGDKEGLMLLCAVSFKKAENDVSEEVKKHERTHQFQFLDCFFISLIPAIYLAIIFNIYFLLIPVFLFYAIYLVEYITSFYVYLSEENRASFYGSGGGAVRGIPV